MNISMMNETLIDFDNMNPNILDPNISTLRTLGEKYDKTLIQYEQSLKNYYNDVATTNNNTIVSNKVKLFTGENYSGNSISIEVGSFSSLANLGLTNNNIGSAIVPQGFSLSLWEGAIKDFKYINISLPPGNYPSIPSIPISNVIEGAQGNNASFTNKIGYSFKTAKSAVVYNNYPNSSSYITIAVARYDDSLYVRNQNYKPGQLFWTKLNHPLNGSLIAVATNPINGNVFLMNKNYHLFFQDSYNDPSPVKVLAGFKPYQGNVFCCVKDFAISQDSSFFLGVGAYNNLGQASIGAVNSANFDTHTGNENVTSFAFAPDNTILSVQNNQIYSTTGYMNMGINNWNGPYTNSNIISSTNNGGIICVRVAPDGTLYGVGPQDNLLYTKSTYKNTGENWSVIPNSGNILSIAFVNTGNPNSSQQNNTAIYMDNSELQNLNAQLTNLNNQIIQVMGKSNPEYRKQIMERSMMNRELLKELNILIAEKNKVNKLIDDYNSLKEEKDNTQIVLNENYYKYILYLILAIIIILVFVLSLFRINALKIISDTIIGGIGHLF